MEFEGILRAGVIDDDDIIRRESFSYLGLFGLARSSRRIFGGYGFILRESYFCRASLWKVLARDVRV